LYGESVISVKQLQQGLNVAAEHPLDHLMACHRRIEDRLATLERAGEAFAAQPNEAMGAIRRSLDFFATNGVRHTADEEESVFPRMLAALDPDESKLIATLEQQHHEAADLHAALDRAVEGLPGTLDEYRKAVQALSGFYRNHIEVEDTTVMPIARRVLNDGQIQEIAAEMRNRRGLNR
jgi:hemerythrin-like domain-containing protein